MLNIVYGTDTSDREAYVDSIIRKNAENGRVSWILVPEQFSLSSEKSVIEDYSIQAQSLIKVITFSRLCNLVFAKLGPLRLKYIDGAGKQIIAARCIRLLSGKLGPLSRTLKQRGFSSTIVNLVSEFKRYGVTPENLSAAAADTDNEELSGKLSDISEIYKTFDSFLNAQSADAEDNLALILPKIKECSFLSGDLFIRNFRSFTPVEYEAIGELMRILNVYAVLCCDDIDKSSSVFSSIANTCQKLTETAEKNGIDCAEPVKIPDRESNSELDFLARNYFAKRPKIYPSAPEDIQIYEVSNSYRETEAAADLILKLCRTENRKFSDFLILARNTESYNRIMPAVFASRGIDIFLDTRRSIVSTPLFRLISSSLEILASGYSYERVMSVARTGLTSASDSEIDEFENYILAVNPSHAMWNDSVWTYAPNGYDIEIINQTRDKILEFLNCLKTCISGKQTTDVFCSAILSSLERCSLADRTTDICDNFSKNNMPYLADEYRQVWNGIISVISQISVLMDSENISRIDFCDLFKNACGGISIGLTPQTQGSVVFSSIDKFRSDGTPVVIVLGMTDGVFPSTHTTEGIISDSEREHLLKLGITLAPGADFKQKEEQHLIYSTLTSASEKLFLFTPQNNTSGAELSPSPVIKRIKSRIFPEITSYNPDTDSDILRGAEGKEAAFEVLCSYLAENKDKISDSAEKLYEYFSSDIEFKERLSHIKNAINTKNPEKLSRESVEAIYGNPIMLSASKLEKYNACAFSYFLSYGLLASERELAGIEPRSTGSIQHETLKRYFEQVDNFDNITREDCYNKIYSITREEAIKSSELLYESSSYYKYIVTRMQGIAARTAWEVVKFYRSSKFRPVGFEIKIDTNAPIPMLKIENNGEMIAGVRGIIDRADSVEIDGKKYISITDYKSSEKKLSERLADAGVNIQPLLYADIICKRMEANPAAMLYMQMTDPIVDASKVRGGLTLESIEREVNKKVKFGGWISDNPEVISSYSSGGENGEKYIPTIMNENELNERIKKANEKIHESALSIYNGNIKAEPYCDKSYNACDFCIFNEYCRGV